MEFFQIRLDEQDRVSEAHPVLAEAYPDLTLPMLSGQDGIEGDFPYLYYGLEDGRVACYFKSFPDKSIYKGQKLTWSWNGNLFTDPDFRRRGLAQALVEQQMQACDRLGMIWGGVFSSVPALRLYEKLGFTMIGMVPRLCALRSITPFLQHHIPRPAAVAGNTLYGVLHHARSAYFNMRQGASRKGILEEITPDVLATLPIMDTWQDEVVHWDTDASWVIRRREARALDRLLLLKETPSGPPLAYATVRQRQNRERPVKGRYFGIDTMTLTHFGSFAPVEVSAPILVSALFEMFRQSGADLLEIISSNPELEAAARGRGMVGLGAGMSFKYYAPEALRHGLPAEGPKNFHLTHYSGDAFDFE